MESIKIWTRINFDTGYIFRNRSYNNFLFEAWNPLTSHKTGPNIFVPLFVTFIGRRVVIELRLFQKKNTAAHIKFIFVTRWAKCFTLFTIDFGAINFGDKIFGSINIGEISTIHRISIEIRSLKIFGVTNFRLSTSSPKLFHTEIYRK